MKKFLLLCFSFVFVTSMVWAQERVVSGRVTAQEDGSALPGVNVVLRGTTNGTVTDADGNYKLSVPSTGGTLVFSFIGQATQEIEIGERTVVDMGMTTDTKQLTEVIVTAQGIVRDKKAIGYAISQVGADQIAARPVNDISRVLQGKIPGVVIAPTGGTSGTGASINIRGYSSITGTTQPLWVVDGVPFNSSTNQASGFLDGGAATASSRFLDLDPNTIENINVLKGLAATVLYGDQGRNGVILVTTKSGGGKKKATEFSIQQTISTTEIASWPIFQQHYGNGFQQLSGVSPVFFSNWGAHFDETDSAGHPYQFLADATLRNQFPETFFQRQSYSAQPNTIGFFRTGAVSNTSFNMSGGTDKLSFNASVAYTSEQGYTPGNDVYRLNLSTGFTAAVTDKLTMRTSILIASTNIKSPPQNAATGGGASFNGVPSLYANFMYSPISLDLLGMPFESPLDKRPVWYRGTGDIPNPRWIAKYTRETDETDRFFNSTTFSYDFTDKIALAYKVGYDTYTQRQNREYNKGIGVSYNVINRGVFQTQTLDNTIWNHDLIATINTSLTSDITMLGRLGVNARYDATLRDGIYSENQVVAGQFRHSNFSTSSSRSIAFDGRVFNRTTEQQRYGIYADFSFDYKDWLFLNLSGRNDWNSAVEAPNQSLFYPSVSASFVPTELFDNLKSDKFNFLKFRLSYGTSAGFPPVYNTRSVVNQNLRGGANSTGTIYGEHTVSNRLGNPLLRGELQTEYEAGIEAKFLNERLGIDFTVYNRETIDLITDTPIDPATGYTTTYLNLGKLRNKGIEIALNATPLKMGGFQWDIIWNFTLVRPEVLNLGDGGLKQVFVAGRDGTVANFAKVGRPTNILIGTATSKAITTGERVVGADGLYLQDPNLQELGDPNPDWLSTIINNFTYKGFDLSVQMDYRSGGKIWSSTMAATIGRGVSSDTDYNRDYTFVLPGVKIVGTNPADNTPIYAPNDRQLTASDYGFNTQFFGYQDVNIVDGTTIRLREVALNYSFPKSIMGKTPFKTASLGVNGNNLWFKALSVPEGTNFDSEVASQGVDNGIGFDYLTGPSVRRYGVVLKLTF